MKTNLTTARPNIRTIVASNVKRYMFDSTPFQCFDSGSAVMRKPVRALRMSIRIKVK